MPQRSLLLRSGGGARRLGGRLRLPVCVVAVLLVAAPAAAGTPAPMTSGAVDLGAAAPSARLSFFASVEQRYGDLAAFRKWQDMLGRYATETAAARAAEPNCPFPSALSAAAAAPAPAALPTAAPAPVATATTGQAPAFSAAGSCPYRDWERFLERLSGVGRWEQLIAVNREMNERSYVTDRINWGVEDYWASPGEFLTRSGDCEDFAIAKYLSLKRLGWSDEVLRIAAVKDLTLGIGHAVLVASYDGRVWVLDNQASEVIESERLAHYQPVFSINESFWWRHRPRPDAPPWRDEYP